MRFDLLDEYSTLVPFGLGTSRNRAIRESAAPARESRGDAGANTASHLELPRKSLGAFRQAVVSSCRSMVARFAYLF